MAAKYTATSETLGVSVSDIVVFELNPNLTRKEVTVSGATAAGAVVTVKAASEGASALYGVAIRSTAGAGAVTAVVRGAVVQKSVVTGLTDAIEAALEVQGVQLA